jgi:hypothetical protein
VRGARRGGGAETLRVSVTTQDGFGVAGGQAQRQSQS